MNLIRETKATKLHVANALKALNNDSWARTNEAAIIEQLFFTLHDNVPTVNSYEDALAEISKLDFDNPVYGEQMQEVFMAMMLSEFTMSCFNGTFNSLEPFYS